MPTPHILIVYGSRYGQTARIANRIRRVLAERDFAVSLYQGDALPAGCRADDYDGALIGASMIFGKYQRYVRDFVERNRAALNRIPTGFFAVSGAAGSANPAERAEAERRLEAFCVETGWQPLLWESVAGAIRYTRYNVVLRWVMKRISRKEGGSTDTSRDHEYTDWVQVEQFADRFADRVDERAHRSPGSLTGAPQTPSATLRPLARG